MAKKQARKQAKKPAKKKAKATTKRVVRKAAPKRVVRKPARKAARKAAPKAKTARKSLKTKTVSRRKKLAPTRASRGAARAKAPSKAPAKKATQKVAKTVVKKAISKAPVAAKPRPKPKAKPKQAAVRTVMPAALPRLDRERRRLPEAELEEFVGTGDDARLLRSARSGHDELRSELKKRNAAGLELTAGDVDANWQDAYAIGDEAPGGDSPTPDQDRVDDIGKALGVVYDDDEELMGGDEIAERDVHRWELDPASKDDDEI